jgi:hypothetical protein
MTEHDRDAHGGDGEAAVEELVQESDAFRRCPNCETVIVKLAAHRCPPEETDGPLPREQRVAAADEDPRDDETTVGIVQRAAGSAYAYHELGEDGNPLCSCLKRAGVTGVTEVTRAEAKRRGRSPCGSCASERGPDGRATRRSRP